MGRKSRKEGAGEEGGGNTHAHTPHTTHTCSRKFRKETAMTSCERNKLTTMEKSAMSALSNHRNVSLVIGCSSVSIVGRERESTKKA